MRASETNGAQPCQTLKENAPHGAGHYLSLVARGGIEPGPRMSDLVSKTNYFGAGISTSGSSASLCCLGLSSLGSMGTIKPL
jgi:hypothetical protein